MTRDSTTPISPPIGAVIRDRIRDLRERSGLTRPELADRAREYGAGDTMTGNVIGFLERGRRGLDLDELVALAAALEVTPLELMGDAGEAFAGVGSGPSTVACPTCEPGEPGTVEARVRRDVAELGELRNLEGSLVETAIRLASAVDLATGDAVAQLPRMTRELRATLAQILAGRKRPDKDEDDLDDLDKPE